MDFISFILLSFEQRKWMCLMGGRRWTASLLSPVPSIYSFIATRTIWWGDWQGSSNNPSFHGWRCKADDTVTLHWRNHPREQVLFSLLLLRYPEMYAPHFSICNLATIYGFLFVTSPRYKVITQQAKEIRFWIKNADL